MEKYKDPLLSIEERVDDLLSRMTLKEKVGQLNQKMYGWDAYQRTEHDIELTDAFKREVAFGDGMGALYGLFRADPWSAVTYENGIPAGESSIIANKVQRYVIEHTRLGIPVLLSEECPHGHQALDGTLLPVNIGAGSTWNPELIEQAYAHAAEEIRARGAHLALVSALDILHEPRWGRSEECYGEDPYHASRMTEAIVRGLQGRTPEELSRPDKVVALLKHLSAQGACVGGRNAGPANIGERELREIHLQGMKAGVEAGAMGCMAAYNEIDGVPCHMNAKLLTGILREEWGFQGIVMADGEAVDRLVQQTADSESAASAALAAGVDLSLWDKAFTTLENAVMTGVTDEERIDRAVRRVLRLKFLLGLFDQPFTDETTAARVIGNEAFRRTNLQVARESAVLLKNEGNQLPLSKTLKRIAVIGPNAHQLYNQLGDYTSTQREGKGTTVLEGIRMAAGRETEVVYAKGCGIRDESKAGFAEAVSAAKDADVAVLVLGGSSARRFDQGFDTNGAAIITAGNPSEMDCGEGVDLSDLRLGGVQEQLVKEIAATGTPVVAVLIQGRPHALTGIVDACDAILCGWYPGQEGGQAIGEILFGDVNPSGRLAVSLPRSTAQLPVYYNQKDPGRKRVYRDITSDPLYPFGYGLSYTTFDYGQPRLLQTSISSIELENECSVVIEVDIENTGAMRGAEVVQLYIKDMEASVTRRIIECKGFHKVELAPGERKTVIFRLTHEELAIWDSEMQFKVEPGNVKIMIGSDSQHTAETMLHITR